MHKDLVQILNCPARDCAASGLALEETAVETIAYRTGTVSEVREGALVCAACGRRYPIEDFVPTFEQLFPADLQEEARYWGDWYGFFWDRGYRGFFDLRAPVAHFIARGIEVPDPGSLSGRDLPGTHKTLAEHPLVQGAERIMDVGCGAGWSSLYLARLGHSVVAFDPSAANVRRAKLYAISQGERIEYIATGLGFLNFKPEVFDAAFALHSIHHVPDLNNEMVLVREWLREGGAIAVDEHIRSDTLLAPIVEELDNWFNEQVAPRYRTLNAEELKYLYDSGHSRMEDAGSSEVLSALAGNFSIESFQTRFVSLDLFSYMYYLWRRCVPEEYTRASTAVSAVYNFLESTCPERAEYVTVLGRKAEGPGPAMPALQKTQKATVTVRDASELRTEAMQEAIEALQATVEALNETVHAKDRHASELQAVIERQAAELARKQAALEQQAALLRRIESGRVMGVINRISKLRKRGR